MIIFVFVYLSVRFNARQKSEQIFSKEMPGISVVPHQELDKLSQALLIELEKTEGLKSDDLVQSLLNKKSRDELMELRIANDRTIRVQQEVEMNTENDFGTLKYQVGPKKKSISPSNSFSKFSGSQKSCYLMYLFSCSVYLY